MYWALKDVSAAEVMAQIRRANPLLFVLSIIIVTLTFPARAVRWQILLEASTGTRPLFRPVWLATAIGFMSNNILPARAGEIARAYAGSQLIGPPVATCLSTIAVERVFDGVVVVLMLALAMVAPSFPDNVRLGDVSLQSIAAGMGLVFGLALVFLAIVAHWPDRTLAIVDAVTGRLLPRKAADWTSRVARNLFSGLSVLRSPKHFALMLLWSVIVWGLNASSYIFAFSAFHLDLPLTATLVLQGITVLSVAVPSSPGYVGVFEAATIAALGIYGVPKEEALGFGLALHMAWFIPITVLGLWALVRAGLSFGQLRGQPSK